MILALLLGAMQSVPALVPVEVAVERVSRCGLGHAKVRYDEILESDVLVVRGRARATDRQLACIDVAAGYYDVELAPVLQARYAAKRTARLAALARADARAWLAARGLLARLPEYRPGKTDDAGYDQALEQLCGPDAAGALAPYGSHMLSAEWVARQDPAKAPEGAFGCLLSAMTASGAMFGFTGNEAFAPER